jgi:UDP-hydrolysing UDP-N-acetyl-D-glucosamine 2-epimerase
MRKICVVLVDRANYGRLKPVMHVLQDHAEIQLQVVCAGTMVLERFQQPVNVVRSHGFPVDSEIYLELEGSTPTTMAKSVGFGVIEFASEFQRLKPDIVLIIGDRYEALSAVLAAAFMNLCIAHIQGGEVSGSIDESTRHAISKYSHYHFPSTKRAADYLVRMGEKPDTILGIGCPSSDIARSIDLTAPMDVINTRGSGITLDTDQPFLLALFHPTTTEFGHESEDMTELLHALERIAMPTLLLWPNIDAGSDHISKQVRVFRDQHQVGWMRTITNLTPEDYIRVLARSACAIGNSSSFVRDSSHFGTPVVLVGHRQDGRETDENVIRCEASRDDIEKTIRTHLAHGRYGPSTLYGDGKVSDRIAAALVQAPHYVQKRLHYIHDAA